MFENLRRLRLVAVAAPISVAMGMTLVSTSSNAAGYVTSSGGVVTNSYGECWESAGGTDQPMEACGDAMPMAEVGDSDGDGVPDDKDRCPNTPRGVAVDSSGCPLDSDGDGVPDYLDKCPGTPAGAKVDSDGCEIMGDVTINVTADHFAFDSAELKPAMMSALDNVAARVRESKGDESLMVIGHTDSTGPEAYNQGLSERRADAAAAYLMQQGVSSDRITTSGRGESAPVADNSTREGRSMNRRVEIQTQ
jgi:OOP family OmpA-OmpF porin